MCDDASAQDAPFVPTVTAISSTPDFQWMVQPTIITSVSLRLGGKQANEAQSSHQATPKEGGSKGKNAGKKGKTEQVGFAQVPDYLPLDAAAGGVTFTYANLDSLCATVLLCIRLWCRVLAASLPLALDLYSGHSKSATMVYF